MGLYPEGSTDGGLRLGNIVPDFKADTTQGKWDSFHAWKKGKWAILFSHPADFTPVCTTEIGRLALKYDQLQALDCLVATLSVDPVKSHEEWLTDVVAHCENKIEIKFPSAPPKHPRPAGASSAAHASCDAPCPDSHRRLGPLELQEVRHDRPWYVR